MNRVLICTRFSDRATDLVSQCRLVSSVADTYFPSLHCPHCHTQINLLSMTFMVLLEVAQTTPNWTHQPLSSQLLWLPGHSLPTLFPLRVPSSPSHLLTAYLSLDLPLFSCLMCEGLSHPQEGCVEFLPHFLQMLLTGLTMFCMGSLAL